MSEKCEKCGEVATCTASEKWYCNTHGVEARMSIENTSKDYEKLKKALFLVGSISALVIGAVVLYDLFIGN